MRRADNWRLGSFPECTQPDGIRVPGLSVLQNSWLHGGDCSSWLLILNVRFLLRHFLHGCALRRQRAMSTATPLRTALQQSSDETQLKTFLTPLLNFFEDRQCF